MTHSLLVLGSGQDGGAPQVGIRSVGRTERSASSVAIVAPNGPVMLLDASPDIRSQYQRLAQHCGRAPGLDGVFITHGHMGHYAGLLHFGMEAAATDRLPLFAPRSVIRFLQSNEPWATLFTDHHLAAMPMDDSEAKIDDLTISAIPVPHRAEYTTTVAYSIAVAGRPWVLYLPDIDGWAEWPEADAVVAAHPVSLLDATFSTVDELPGRDMTSIKHPLVPDTVERFAHLTTDHTIILTHINHSNPLGERDAAITSVALDHGFTIAHDGLLIDHA